MKLSKIRKDKNTTSVQKVAYNVSLLLAFFCGTIGFAQNQSKGFKLTDANVRAMHTTGFVRCATVEYEQKLSKENPNKVSEEVFESWMSTKVAQLKKSRTNGRLAAQIYTIPVVIHIVHNGDEINTPGNVTGENISDAQARSQIEILNQDYRRMVGTPGGNNSTGKAVDVEINFVLAKQDPDGLETTGIIRHEITPYTDDIANKFEGGLNDGGADWENYADVQKMKRETQWDPTKYLNIWTIRMGGEKVEDDGLSDLLGFAQFPSNSGLQGIDVIGGSAATDGVVISFHAFGAWSKNDRSFLMNNQYSEGRTTTHEVGHWLGLRHIWGDTDTCENGDYCLDTPDATEEHYDCSQAYDTCLNDGLGNDMVENYMDYTTDGCMDTFTQNQKDRMIAVLNNSPRRVDLLNSPALESPLYSKDDLEGFVTDPNPFTDIVKIVGMADGLVKVSVYNTSGKVVYSENFYDIKTVFSKELNFNQLAPGIYILLIQNKEKRIVKRIIKR
ncbi:M43 family zinc metalloprotease [Wenyingzhuangia sp. chi5]|uniref:M43 family zinc metalloprotease n=1 Tax=Wenyingzhuangia gilva TaxID=3057677 RepID=A0ABT8VV54_9FLAO|nr:M43 family zinc metalloprotease [Wenyingzhuangia sp. chi5]MDO3695846.1 M43 family zinc metalloprotease [Wenyingzhuangia sp. chi5]